MKPSQVYLKAAKVVGTTCGKDCQWTCCAIATIDKEEDSLTTSRYRDYFMPSQNEEQGWWNSHKDHYQERTLALLLMSEIARDEERK